MSRIKQVVEGFDGRKYTLCVESIQLVKALSVTMLNCFTPSWIGESKSSKLSELRYRVLQCSVLWLILFLTYGKDNCHVYCIGIHTVWRWQDPFVRQKIKTKPITTNNCVQNFNSLNLQVNHLKNNLDILVMTTQCHLETNRFVRKYHAVGRSV